MGGVIKAKRGRKDVLETNVRVNHNSGADDGVHDGAHGTSSEGSNAKRDETGRDDSIIVSFPFQTHQSFDPSMYIRWISR